MVLMLHARLAVIDLETTGMTATADRITEIGIVTIVDGKVVDEWSTLVNPECAIPGEIQSLTGITDQMVRDAPAFRQIADEVLRRLSDHVFVAHNARFDYGFIKNEFRRLGQTFTADVLCTVRLSRRLYPQYKSHSLDALRERHRLTLDGRHRALGDARAAWQFIETATREHSQEDLAAAVKALLKMPSLPPQLAPGCLDDLPEGPGVYTFYGVSDLPIYIGKAKDIRARVRSHFSSDHRSANDQRLSTEIMRIEYEETAGELGALLREASLIKSRMPLRNHRLRRNQEVAFVRIRDLASPPEFLSLAEVDFAQTGNLFGPFATKSRARATLLSLAADNELCWQVMSAKKIAGPCFAYQIHRCRGYCMGKENLLQHNLRLLGAMAPYKFRDWPIESATKTAVAITETHPEHGWEQVHLFDQWLYLGSARSEADFGDLRQDKTPVEFDADIYKLLLKYFDGGGRYTSVSLAAPISEAA
jgi:DNA polymerase III subunit epsilon